MLRTQDIFEEDAVTDAQKRLGSEFYEEVFFKAAVIANTDHPGDHAMALMRVWLRCGYKALPGAIKDAILKINNGEVH